MPKLSLLDEIKILLETSKTSKLYIAIIIFLIFFAYILLTTNKKNKKTSQTIFILIYTFIFLFIIIVYNTSLKTMLDYLMNNLFIIIYFPNLAVYLVAIIATNIIIWISIFNFNTTKFIKNINITIYCILNYLFALILNIITTKKLDIYSTQSVYSNKNALALIELSSIIFTIWIIFLIVYKIFLLYLKKNHKKKAPKLSVEKKKRRLPDNIIETKLPATVSIVKSKNYLEKANLKNYEETKEFEKMLTLDDYKLLLQLLKESKINFKKETSTDIKNIPSKEEIAMPEIIESKNYEAYLEEPTRKKEEFKEQTVFDELKRLYDIN